MAKGSGGVGPGLRVEPGQHTVSCAFETDKPNLGYCSTGLLLKVLLFHAL